jgi:hypothetical protein
MSMMVGSESEGRMYKSNCGMEIVGMQTSADRDQAHRNMQSRERLIGIKP